MRKWLYRAQVTAFIAQLPPTRIGMEVCGGAHYWARRIREHGHEVKLMAPQFVTPYRKAHKNDLRDAEAIAEAVTRPTMRFLSVKSVAQQDLQALHRVRERLMKARTALINETRGLLHEYGPAGAYERICAAAHIRSYVEFRNMWSLWPGGPLTLYNRADLPRIFLAAFSSVKGGQSIHLGAYLSPKTPSLREFVQFSSR